ncbi:MAG: hypothetical protein IT184_10025 [Acidobacteria bacterium]|nr:hypothetical protein [Acidobacteriota bacterium]
MLPGRKYAPEDILAILWRRVWLVLVPFAVISAATAVYVRRLPNLYASEAIIIVQPPRVPENMVSAAAPPKLEDRLPAIQQQVMSRTRLERIIVDLDLYPVDRKNGIMEDIVERVRDSIAVEIVRGDAFKVRYVGEDPRTVMKVADRVSSLLIDESNRDRSMLLEGTDQFLESQLEDARRRLIEHEKKVEQYRRKYAGELPAQMNSNLQAVQSNEMQVQALVTAMDRDQERRILLERQLAELEAAAQDPSAMAGPETSTTAQQLGAERAKLTQMQLVLKADHPDVQQQKRLIRDLEAKLENESLSRPLSTEGGRNASPAEQSRQRRIEETRSQLVQLDRALARNTAEVQRLRKLADTYFQRAEAGPTRETEMVELNRDYTTLGSLYANLLAKKEEASLARNLETRQIGAQFKILDSARLPNRPFSPNRQRLNLMGMAAGLAIGLGLVGLLEYRNASMQTDDELAAILKLPVLAVVPVMEADEDRRRRKRWRLLIGAGLGGIVAGCLSILVYTFVR